MPLLLRKHLRNGIRVYVWKITESEETLLSSLSPHLRAYYLGQLDGMRSARRRLEWIAARVVVHSAAGIDEVITYSTQGVPRFESGNCNISISHSDRIVFVVLSKAAVGIDVQRYSNKLEQIIAYFMNAQELTAIPGCHCGGAEVLQPIRSMAIVSDTSSEGVRRRLLLVWSAKEAIYKLCSGSILNLRERVTVSAGNIYRYGYTGAHVKEEAQADNMVPASYMDIRYVFHKNYVFVIATYC